MQYETLSPKMQAIEQKLQDLKKAMGTQHKQTQADLDRLIADFKKIDKGDQGDRIEKRASAS